MSNIEQDIGALKAEVANLKVSVHSMDEKLDRIDHTLTKAWGGWIALSAFGGAVVYLITNVIIPFMKGN